MHYKLINLLLTIIPILIVAVSIWAFDLHELFIKEKRTDRIKIIQADIQRILDIGRTGMKKISGFWKKLTPYIVRLLKFLLRLTGKLFCLAVKLLKWLFQKLKEIMQVLEDRQYQVNPALFLAFEENLELAEALAGHPYEVPVFISCNFDHYFAVSYEFSAAGIVPRYAHMEPEGLERIIIQTIKAFFAKKRKVQVYVRIIVATPIYLHFIITYTPYGWNRLLQIYPLPEDTESQTPPPPLEETIPEEEDAGEGAEEEDAEEEKPKCKEKKLWS